MAKKKTESLQKEDTSSPDSPDPALKLRQTLRGHTHNVYRMALSPDGRILASSSNDNTVRVWDVETGRALQTLEHPTTVVCVAWSPDTTALAVGGGHQNKKVYLWDAATGQQTRILEGHTNIINEVAWGPDGKILASCSRDQTIRLWDAATGKVLRRLTGHSNDVHSLTGRPMASDSAPARGTIPSSCGMRKTANRDPNAQRARQTTLILWLGHPTAITSLRVPMIRRFASGMPKLGSSNTCWKATRIEWFPFRFSTADACWPRLARTAR